MDIGVGRKGRLFEIGQDCLKLHVGGDRIDPVRVPAMCVGGVFFFCSFLTCSGFRDEVV